MGVSVVAETSRGRLRVITVREEGRLLALLPLCEVGYAKLPIRRLVFMGAPGIRL